MGARFWGSLRQLLDVVEKALARWCVLELGISDATLGRLWPPRDPRPQEGNLDADALDGVPSPAAARALWGEWWGREREFYRKAGRLVGGLAWDQVVAIGSQEVRIFSRTTREAFRALVSPALPARLVPAAIHARPAGPRQMHLVAYSGQDPLAFPREVVDLVPFFDGRPTREALRRIKRRTGRVVEGRLIQMMVDFEILVPPPEPPLP